MTLRTIRRKTAGSSTTRRTAGRRTEVTSWIQREANELLNAGLDEVKRVPFEQALRGPAVRPTIT